MSPWPRVVIQGVFVEQANTVCYLLCSRFISENCIVPPFGEQVMECGGKQRDCHSPGFWWCCSTLLKGSHILPVILTLHLTCQHTACVCFWKHGEKELWMRALMYECLYIRECYKHKRRLLMHAEANTCDFAFFPISTLWSTNPTGLLSTFFAHICFGDRGRSMWMQPFEVT